ncbi:unnamed protein product, partial [Hapterophycus canaliculatus]
MQMVRDILMYMDRTFVSVNKKMPVYEMGLVVFRDTVARHEKVKGRLQSLLLQVRRRARNARPTGRVTPRACL